MSFEDKQRFATVIRLSDRGFILEDGSIEPVIVGSTDNFGPTTGEPCALKLYLDPRGWRYNCLCLFPPEERDALFIVEGKKMGSRLREGERIIWSNWADTKIFTVRQVYTGKVVPPTTVRQYPEWTIVDRNYGYRPGSGSLQIVKNNNGQWAIGYDAAELAEGRQPDYVVKYCNSMDECLEYARGEGYK